MGETTIGRTRISKSRNGCGECRRKRSKCDEHHPTCWNCARRKVECPGYTRELKWSTKHERFRTPRARVATTRQTALPLCQEYEPAIQATDIKVPTQAHADEDANTKSPTLSERQSDASHDSHAGSSDDLGIRDEGTETTPSSVGEPYTSGSELHLESRQHNDNQHYDEELEYSDQVIRSPSTKNGLVNSPGIRQYLATWNESLPTNRYRSVDRLFSHYFDNICRVMSCFDSTTNPYRTEIPSILHSSPYIFNCMMGMAAAHMANFDKEMAVTAISYQTEAMESLKLHMNCLLPLRNFQETNPHNSTYETLLGAIMLGLTSAWHDPSADGMSHLRGARFLFRTWSTEQQLYDVDGKVKVLTREQSFIIGSLAYWECSASFIIEQPVDAIQYLLPFCNLHEKQTIYPHPWTGVATPIYIMTAQLGILLRQKRVLERLTLIRRGSEARNYLDLELMQEANDLHGKIVRWALPSPNSMEETGDVNTPLSHLCELAKVYRFTTLLELYRAFPLLVPRSSPEAMTADVMKLRCIADDMAFDLATSIITIISKLPRTSCVYTAIWIPLISAGAALQAFQPSSSSLKRGCLGADLTQMRRSRPNVDRWRECARQQILHTSKRVGLAAFKRLARLVQEVWTRSDMHADMAADPQTFIHWIDVMIDQHLETLFG